MRTMAHRPASTEQDRPIFVIGCPRSGTTLLQVMLHSHPRIAIPPETHFVVRAYRDRLRFGDLRHPDNRRELAGWIVGKGTRFVDLGLPRRAVVERIVAGPPTLGSAVGAVFGSYAERFGKPRWGDKRPSYWRNLDVVLRMFPDAQVIQVVRDPRACAASLLRVPWWRHGFYGAVSTWRLAVSRPRRLARKLPPGSYLEIRYEDLVTRPAETLGAVCSFLGEAFDDGMLAPAGTAPVAVPERKWWHERTRGDIDASRIDAWRGQLAPWQVGLVEHVARRQMARLGYRPTGAPRPSLRCFAGYWRHELWRRRRIARDACTDAWLRLRHPMPVAALPNGDVAAATGADEHPCPAPGRPGQGERARG